jgi:xylulokinase
MGRKGESHGQSAGRVGDAPLVVAIDASTTAVKAIAFDSVGIVVAASRREIDRSSPQPGWQEQDSLDWWRAAAGSLRSVTEQVDGSRFLSLAITHQRETFVPLDELGEPLRSAILWIDVRAADQIHRLGSRDVHARSGKPPSTTPALYKMAWLAEHEPEVLARTSQVVDVHAYLVRKLTGRAATSWASADPLGILDQRRFVYDAGLVAIAGLSLDQLPELVAPGSVIGEVTSEAAAETGLPAGLPVIAGAGDGQCAGLGAAVTRAGLAYLNLGTGLTLGTHAEHYTTDVSYRTLSSPIAGRWTLEALLASGALSLSWFAEKVAREAGVGAEQRLERLAEQVPPGSGGLMFLPYLTSAETPYWDPLARGAWVGLREAHSLGHMYRAVLEGIAFEERMVLDLIDKSTGVPIREMRAMGGGSKSRLWLRILSDVLERDVRIGDQSETTALGAAILAAAGVGMAGEADVARTAERMTGVWKDGAPAAPRPRVYDLASTVYQQLYPALAGLYPALDRISRSSV